MSSTTRTIRVALTQTRNAAPLPERVEDLARLTTSDLEAVRAANVAHHLEHRRADALELGEGARLEQVVDVALDPLQRASSEGVGLGAAPTGEPHPEGDLV